MGQRDEKSALVGRLCSSGSSGNADNNSLSMAWNIPDDQRTFGVSYRVAGSAAMRAKAGDRLGRCPNVILGLSFLEVDDIKTGQFEEIYRHVQPNKKPII